MCRLRHICFYVLVFAQSQCTCVCVCVQACLFDLLAPRVSLSLSDSSMPVQPLSHPIKTSPPKGAALSVCVGDHSLGSVAEPSGTLRGQSLASNICFITNWDIRHLKNNNKKGSYCAVLILKREMSFYTFPSTTTGRSEVKVTQQHPCS